MGTKYVMRATYNIQGTKQDNKTDKNRIIPKSNYIY